MSMLNRMKELITILNEAGKKYYQENQEIMSNFEYDKLYDELVLIEKELGTIVSNSPTRNVGYKILSSLPKEEHLSSMLSLDKTKDREELKSWIKEEEGLMSLKLDGLTIVLTYNNGVLMKAVTRGNGFIGEVVTSNCRMFKNIPMEIAYKDELVLRGEAVIRYSDFKAINAELDEDNQYKNPRNLCSGSVRQLNNEITANRNVRFYGFTHVSSTNKDEFKTKAEEIDWLLGLGFDCVDYQLVNKDNILEKIEYFQGLIEKEDIGSDGLVLTFNNKEYSNSLGSTSKFPKDTIAFKWQDEVKETTLIEVFWSASRTGRINPVAIFEPVDLEGTSVARASLHNISIIEKLELGTGDRINVYKANMIIPQIAENLTRSNTLEIPMICPVCGMETQVKEANDIKALYCINDDCAAKKVKSFAHFVSRNAMNIEGLSEATLEKLIQLGMIHEFSDLFTLNNEEKKKIIIELDGFGEKSYTNLLKSVEAAKVPKMPNFIFSLGILHVGLSNAKLLCKAYNNDMGQIFNAGLEELETIEGYGDVIAKSLYNYFHNDKHMEALKRLLEFVSFAITEKVATVAAIEGKIFVITGSLVEYENRMALKEVIENLGGKVTGSVSAKTDYLINNDTESNSSKNKKAKSLDIPILAERDFMSLIE